MGKVDAFTIDGVEVWFNSSDHTPPHFHTSRAGEWEIRVHFLLCTKGNLVFETKWAKHSIARRDREIIFGGRIESPSVTVAGMGAKSMRHESSFVGHDDVPELTVVVWEAESESAVPKSNRIRVLRGAHHHTAAERAPNLFVLVSAINLPEVSTLVSHANRRNQLRALFIREDKNTSWLPHFLERAGIRILRNTLVHTDDTIPRRVLSAWSIAAQNKLIADATVSDDQLFVISCALKRFDVPFERFAALRNMPNAERSNFTIQPDGAYIHWARPDVHLDLEAIRFAIDSGVRRRATRIKAHHDERYGQAIARVREKHGLKQSDIEGLSERQVRRIEKGEGTTFQALERLAQAHGISLQDYLTQLADTVGIPSTKSDIQDDTDCSLNTINGEAATIGFAESRLDRADSEGNLVAKREPDQRLQLRSRPFTVGEILSTLPATGPSGFEGLVRRLLEELSGLRFHLARSGDQQGRDARANRPAGGSVAIECKRYCYDAAGNLLLNSPCPSGSFTPTYEYDAENRLYNPQATYTYSYDADGVRIRKAAGSTVGTFYWPAPNGEYLTETDGSTNINEEYIYFNGQRIARIDRPSGTVHYYFADQLNSASVITDPAGNVQERYYYYPYGGLVASIGSDINHYKFTGKQRDSETGEFGLDNFGARYYASSVGRFMTPDWAARPTEVPYAVFGDPQTLNLYTYVENAPLNRADADGHVANSPALPNPACEFGGTGCDEGCAVCFDESPGAMESAAEAQYSGMVSASSGQNKKPLTPAQIKKAFYKQHGKDFNAAVQKVFRKGASKVPTQTLANSPHLDTSKSRADLSAMGKGEPTEARNRPNSDTYQAKDGTVFIPTETVASGNMNAIFGDYAHETANLLDVQVNGFKGHEENYGNPDSKTNFNDPDTGMNVEVTMFGSPQYP